MPLLAVWQHSGVTRRYGFDLIVHVTNTHLPDQPFVQMSDRAPQLLDGMGPTSS